MISPSHDWFVIITIWARKFPNSGEHLWNDLWWFRRVCRPFLAFMWDMRHMNELHSEWNRFQSDLICARRKWERWWFLRFGKLDLHSDSLSECDQSNVDSVGFARRRWVCESETNFMRFQICHILSHFTRSSLCVHCECSECSKYDLRKLFTSPQQNCNVVVKLRQRWR